MDSLKKGEREEGGYPALNAINNLQNLPLDTDIYRKITKISYAEHMPIARIINNILREYIDVYLLWRKVGYILISKEATKKAMSHMPDEELLATAESIATRIREAATILHGNNKASLDIYLELIKSFASVNGFDVERSKDVNGKGIEVLIIQFRLNQNYSKFLGNAFRLLIEEFADITNFDTTNNLAFIEYKKRIEKETVEVE